MADFIKMPDGSLIMVGKPAPKPSAWERFKATVRAIPDRFSPKPAPWWIEQRQAVQARAPVAPAQPVAVQQAGPTGFGEAEAETARMQRINREFGTLPQRVLASEFFVGKEKK